MDSDSTETSQKTNIITMQLEKFKLFKLQDQEKGHFDVAFEFDGKLLYANKYVLVTASETLNSWLSDRWTKTDNPIKIETYTFDIFYPFCTFLYSGGCKLTEENIFQMIDVAEFFGIHLLKDYCEAFLLIIRFEIFTDDNIFEMFDFAEKYSLRCFSKAITDVLLRTYEKTLNDSKFKTLSKASILRFCEAKNERYRYHYYDIAESEFFKAVYKWAEHQAQIKKDESNDEEFNVEEAIKNEFNEFLPYIKFLSIDIDLLMFYYTKKSFLFSLSEWLKYISQADGNQEETIKAIYRIAETLALEEKQKSGDKNFNVSDSIKSHLGEYLPKIDLCQISFSFMTEFILERCFLFSLNSLLRGLYVSRKSSSSEEKMFKIMYELTEEEVLQKQKLNPVENFNVNDAIKTELADWLPGIEFRQMDKTFLLEFVVGKGILSYDEIFGSKNITVKIKNEDRGLYGFFEDNLGIAEKIGKDSIPTFSYKNMKQRFPRFKFEIPSTPSELKKKDGIQWYLCLEWDGVLAAKNKTSILDTDYLIAELQSYGNFHINGCTYLTISHS